MDLKPRISHDSAAPAEYPSRVASPDREPGCCTDDDRHHSLVLTQLDGATEGFPLTWLYRWQWRRHAAHERLNLTLTEHEIEIRGKNLGAVQEHLTNGRGLHLRVKDQRYFSLQPQHLPQIASITIQSTAEQNAPLN